MAKAYKCDCCYKCFDPQDTPKDLFITFKDGFIFKGENVERLEALNGNKYEEFIHNIDLCKDCSEKFISLLKSNKKEEKIDEKINDTNDPLVDFNKSVNEFLKDIGSRGTAILRDFVYGNSDGKTSEREGKSEKESKD